MRQEHYPELALSLMRIRATLGGILSKRASPPRAAMVVKAIFPKDPKKLKRLIAPEDVRSIIKDNCSLIKTVDKDQIPGIERRVKRIYEGTSTPDSLVRYLENECDVAPVHAELIARDQMQKAEAHFRLQRMRQQGVKLVRWVHGGSKEPRPWHLHSAPHGLNGLVFPIDKPPVIDPKTGERGYPGDLIGCQCHLEAVGESPLKGNRRHNEEDE